MSEDNISLHDLGHYDGDFFVFNEPFPLLGSKGVTLLERLDLSRVRAAGIDRDRVLLAFLDSAAGLLDGE